MVFKILSTFVDQDDMEKLSALASHYGQNGSVISGKIVETEYSKSYLVTLKNKGLKIGKPT